MLKRAVTASLCSLFAFLFEQQKKISWVGAIINSNLIFLKWSHYKKSWRFFSYFTKRCAVLSMFWNRVRTWFMLVLQPFSPQLLWIFVHPWWKNHRTINDYLFMFLAIIEFHQLSMYMFSLLQKRFCLCYLKRLYVSLIHK